MAWELDWDEIYKTQGEVQSDVLPTAIMAAELFKKENIRTILDLGCGMGRHSVFFAKQGFGVTATDISEKGVEETRRKAATVFCIWTSGHGTHADMVKHAHEMLRVTKPDGLIFADYVSKEDSLYGVGKEDEQEIREIYAGHELIVNPYVYSFSDSLGYTYYIKANVAICKK